MADTQRTVPMMIVTIVSVMSGVSGKIRNVYWNTSTTSSLSQGPLTVTVNEGNLPWEYDQVNLICPRGVGEEHVIYSVDREEFEGCRVRGPRPRIVAVCNRPETFMYFTITFRSFTPTPGGLEFRPGQEYYFISTANKRDIHRRVGGWCSSHNMKMIVRVADDANISENIIEDSTTTKPRPIPTPAAFWSKYWRSAKIPGQEERYSHEPLYRERSRTRGVSVGQLRSGVMSFTAAASSLILPTLVLVTSLGRML